MLLRVEFDRGRELPADRIEARAGHGQAHADLQGCLGGGGTSQKAAECGGADALEDCPAQNSVARFSWRRSSLGIMKRLCAVTLALC